MPVLLTLKHQGSSNGFIRRSPVLLPCQLHNSDDIATTSKHITGRYARRLYPGRYLTTPDRHFPRDIRLSLTPRHYKDTTSALISPTGNIVHRCIQMFQTCKSLLSMTQSRSVWIRFIHVQILEHNLPISGFRDGTLDTLSAQELEGSLRRAISLRQNWSSASPKPTKQIDIVPTLEPMSRSIFLDFLPGRGNRWLLSITLSGGAPRRFTFQCWDVDASPPCCVAILEHVGSFGGIAINSHPNNDAILALQFTRLVTSPPPSR